MLSRFLIFLSLLMSQLVAAQTAAELQKESEALFDKQQYTQALERINQAIELDNRQASLFYTQALTYRALGKLVEADLSFKKALILDPEDYNLLSSYGYFLHSRNFSLEAVPFFEKAAQNCPNQDTVIMLYINLSAAQLASRNPQAAEKALKKVYDYDSTHLGALNNLSMLYQQQQRYPEALVCLQKMLQYDTTGEVTATAHTNIGFVYQSMNEHERALPFFDKCIEAATTDKTKGIAYCNRGYSKLKLGQKKAALEDLNKSIEVYEINSYAWRVRGEVYLALKKKKKACENWEMAIKLRYTEQWGDEAVNLQRQHCK